MSGATPEDDSIKSVLGTASIFFGGEQGKTSERQGNLHTSVNFFMRTSMYRKEFHTYFRTPVSCGVHYNRRKCLDGGFKPPSWFFIEDFQIGPFNGSEHCVSSAERKAMGRLANKIAVVIGAGQSPGESIGNGRATALRFMEEGASILAVDRDVDSAKATLKMAKGGIGEAFEADVRHVESLKLAIDFAVSRWGRIDILHYNVGVSVGAGDGPLDAITEESFDIVMEINLRGAIMAAKLVEPIMRAQRAGVLLNVSSMSAIETSSTNVAYRASKAGLLAFTPAVRDEERPFWRAGNCNPAGAC